MKKLNLFISLLVIIILYTTIVPVAHAAFCGDTVTDPNSCPENCPAFFLYQKDSTFYYMCGKPTRLVIPGYGPISSPVGFRTLGDVISKLIPYFFVLAGLALFGFLIFGGFELLTSAGNPEKVKSAQAKITSAIIGFIIIFAAYWIVQVLEVIFGIEILGVK